VIDDAELAALLASSVVTLNGRGVTPAQARTIAAAPLTSLSILRDAGFGDDGLSALAGRCTETLEALSLESVGATARGVRALARRPMPSLRELRLGTFQIYVSDPRNQIGDDGVATIAGWELPSLTALAINGVELGDRGMRALAQSHLLPHLTQLSLCDNLVTDAGLTELLDAHPPRLATLAIAGNPCGATLSTERDNAGGYTDPERAAKIAAWIADRLGREIDIT
jgi:hypothetical protein